MPVILEMWLRFALHGPVGFIEADQAVYRRHEKSMSITINGGCSICSNASGSRLRSEFSSQVSSMTAPISTHPREPRKRCRFAGRAAFNRGETEECKRILEFAVALWPNVRPCPMGTSGVEARFGRRLWSAIILWFWSSGACE